MTKAGTIKKLLSHGDFFTVKEIALRAGCDPAYVRAVRNRMNDPEYYNELSRAQYYRTERENRQRRMQQRAAGNKQIY